MNKYHDLKVLKSVKEQTKIAFFYLIDMMFISAIVFGIFQMQALLMLPPTHHILLTITGGLFGVFLCLKPISGGGNRNGFIMYKLLTMDRNVYTVQSYRKVRKQGENKVR